MQTYCKEKKSLRLTDKELEEDRLEVLLESSKFLEKQKHAHLTEKYSEQIQSMNRKTQTPNPLSISSIFEKFKSFIW